MKMTVRSGLLEYLKSSEIQNLDVALCQALTWIDEDIAQNANAVYGADEIQKILIYLAKLRQQQYRKE